MRNFAESVQFNEPLAGTLVAARGPQVFKYLANLPVNNFVQKTAWQYRLKTENTCTLEITRYDSLSEARSNTTAKDPSKFMRTRWGASLYNRAWDTTLSENANLVLGEMANWNPTLQTFFPWGISTSLAEANAGFHKFLQNVDAVAAALEGSGVKGAA